MQPLASDVNCIQHHRVSFK